MKKIVIREDGTKEVVKHKLRGDEITYWVIPPKNEEDETTYVEIINEEEL